MPQTRSQEIEQLKEQIAQLTSLIEGAGNIYHIPDSIQQLPELSGSKKELNAWLQEPGELYNEFKVKGAPGAPDILSWHSFRPIRNKIKGVQQYALTVTPKQSLSQKTILREYFNDQRDFATNLHNSFHTRRGDRKQQPNVLFRHQIAQHKIQGKFSATPYVAFTNVRNNHNRRTLEDAYQAIVTNYNVEVRKPIYKQKPFSVPPQSTATVAKAANQFKKYDETTNRRPFPPKPRVEYNKTEEADLVEDEEYEEEACEEGIQVESEELNFHQALLRNVKP